MFAVLVVSAFLFPASMPVRASQAPGAARCQVVNLMPSFWRFWDAAKDRPPSTQLLLFDEMVVKEHPEVYREGVLSIGSGGPDLTTQIANFLRGAPADIAAMRKLSEPGRRPALVPERLSKSVRGFCLPELHLFPRLPRCI